MGSSIAGMQSGIPFGQLGQSGYVGAGNTMNMGYQNQLSTAQYGQAERGMTMDLIGALGGAAIGKMQEGGVVPEAGALPISPVPGNTDRKLLMATPGEFVVPKDVVEWKGKEFFHKLQTKAREDEMAIEIGKRQVQGQQAIQTQRALLDRQSPQAIPVGA